MSKFITGDIHGSYDRLMRALELCKFSDNDTLYCTGDIGDRGPQIKACLEFLMSLGDRFKPVIGNHDIWAYLKLSDDIRRNEKDVWRYNGGQKTIEAFKEMDEEVLKAWYGKFPYMIEEDDFRLVHTLTFEEVLNRCTIPLQDVKMENLYSSGLTERGYAYDGELFDREILYQSRYFQYKDCSPDWARKVCPLLDDKLTVVGHTPLTGGVLYDRKLNVCDIDTGGFCTYEDHGYEGRITVLDIDTKDFVDSSGLKSNLNDVEVQY